MLNLSLHKLHVARQNHDQDLRRSVLICNMLRYIEDEIEKDAIAEGQLLAAAAAAAAATPPPPPSAPPLPSPLQALQQQQSASSTAADNADHYWPPSSVTAVTTAENYSSTTYLSTTTTTSTAMATDTSLAATTAPLKDFNSAFRSASYSHDTATTSDVTTDGLSLTTLTSTTTSTTDDRTGINWGSVLSLGSQSELDPLNNNSFNTDGGWAATSVATANTSSAVAATTSSQQSVTLTELDLPGQSFDDISWKLAGSDDVLGSLKSFPSTSPNTSATEDNTFVR